MIRAAQTASGTVWAAAMAALPTTAIAGAHHALDPAGPQAASIGRAWSLYVGVATLVYLLVLVSLIIPAWRRRRTALEPASDQPITAPPAAGERRRTIVVTGAVLLTAATLLTLLISDHVAGRSIHAMNNTETLTIKLTGHQWWWEAQYQDPVPSNLITTANEIHIPVGRPVKFELHSADVIHSFWIPNLHGKKDMIPGHPVSIWLQADRLGTYEGQCAEYCGYQHAKMRLQVVAETPEQFQKWLENQRQPARQPTTESQKRGQQVLLSSTCIMCHTIGGTPARGRVGPPLTHIGSRSRLAANTVPNTRGHLGGWILDPQRIKPGARMPQHSNFQPDDFHALLDYLDSLK